MTRRNKGRVYCVLSFLQEKLSGAPSGSGPGCIHEPVLVGPLPAPAPQDALSSQPETPCVCREGWGGGISL